SRQKAQALILAGQILVNNQRVDKAGQQVDINADVRIKGEQLRYVSRAGLKLEAALSRFKVVVEGKNCLDVGASTGGFTDCLLQHGAEHVVAIDVGHNQLAWRLRQHPCVEVREGINARFLTPNDFTQHFDLITVDVSFISLTKILPALSPLLTSPGQLITLIKPQFEVGKGEVGKGGIVSDPSKHARVLKEILTYIIIIGLIPKNLMASPILGADGNREFLALMTNYRAERTFDIDKAIATVVQT
ncbi:MAG: TlyA family RNA methyltransferase, partial [Acidobacteriota bacterium]